MIILFILLIIISQLYRLTCALPYHALLPDQLPRNGTTPPHTYGKMGEVAAEIGMPQAQLKRMYTSQVGPWSRVE